jgi:hypothetical protein
MLRVMAKPQKRLDGDPVSGEKKKPKKKASPATVRLPYDFYLRIMRVSAHLDMKPAAYVERHLTANVNKDLSAVSSQKVQEVPTVKLDKKSGIKRVGFKFSPEFRRHFATVTASIGATYQDYVCHHLRKQVEADERAMITEVSKWYEQN